MRILTPRRNNVRHSRRSIRRRRLTRFETLEARQMLAGDIRGTVYNDVNNDGFRDQGEAGLVNWTVFLDTNQDGSIDAGEPSTLTDAEGKFSFLGIPAGDYRVTEIVRGGWAATNPTTGFSDVTLADGQERTVNFLNHGSGGTGSITGNVWRDLNGDGIQGPSDTGIAGWTVFLDFNEDKILDPDEPFELTDGDG